MEILSETPATLQQLEHQLSVIYADVELKGYSIIAQRLLDAMRITQCKRDNIALKLGLNKISCSSLTVIQCIRQPKATADLKGVFRWLLSGSI